MNLLILDTETTGLGPDAVCVEVAGILYSVTHAAAIRSFASLIRSAENPARVINRIPDTILVDAPAPETVWPVVARMAEKADALIAHNAAFDRRFVPAGATADRPWICSKNDLTWPRAQRPGESLVTLALAHDLGVSHAHRAMVDCDLIARLLSRVAEMGHDLGAFVARGLRPKATFQAIVSFDRKDEAKAAGFEWDPAARVWVRTMAIEDAAALPFDTRRIDNG